MLGQNDKGQVGDGTTTDRLTPVDVSGLTSGVTALTAGQKHTCAVTIAGAVKCWGLNDKGQLGDGTATDRSLPVSVTGLPGAAGAIAAGERHTCAVTTGGAVLCWGYNSDGQLGDGSQTDRTGPVAVSGLGVGFGDVAGGQSHSCAIAISGAVRCWGRNDKGQLGDGTQTDRLTPVPVGGLTDVRAISAGQKHTCVATLGGKAACWGQNADGQLGDGSKTDRLTPVAVSGLTAGVVDIATGTSHSCAMTLSGSGWCWGKNGQGRLGDGTTTDSIVPVLVLGIP